MKKPETAIPPVRGRWASGGLDDVKKPETAIPSGTSDNELLGEFKELLAVTAREVSQAATVPALEAVFQQWNERLAGLTQGVTALHDQTLSDYRTWEGERQTALDTFREKLQQAQAVLTEASVCCRDTQSFLQGVRQQGEAALKTHGQLVEEFLRAAGERASQMAEAVAGAECWLKKETGQWEALLLQANDKVTRLDEIVRQNAEQSETQAKTWQELLGQSAQTLAQFTQTVQANKRRLVEESSAWRTAVSESSAKVAQLTQSIENADKAFCNGIVAMEQQIRAVVETCEKSNQSLATAAEGTKQAGADAHHLLSAVVKRFNEICTNTSAHFQQSTQQMNTTLVAVLSAVQDSNKRLRTIEETLARQKPTPPESPLAFLVQKAGGAAPPKR
jgi:hypothetical protein